MPPAGSAFSWGLADTCHPFNVRISGLNVCGLHSKLKLGILQKYIDELDIIRLSETKCDTLQSRRYSQNRRRKRDYVFYIGLLIQKEKLEHCEILTECSNETVMRITFNDSGFILLGFMYLPGESSLHQDVEITDDNGYYTVPC